MFICKWTFPKIKIVVKHEPIAEKCVIVKINEHAKNKAASQTENKDKPII